MSLFEVSRENEAVLDLNVDLLFTSVTLRIPLSLLAPSSKAVTTGARVFDYANGELRYTDGGVFYHLPESAVNYRDKLPDVDAPTLLFDCATSQHIANRAGIETDHPERHGRLYKKVRYVWDECDMERFVLF